MSAPFVACREMHSVQASPVASESSAAAVRVIVARCSRCPVVPRWVSVTVVTVGRVSVSTSWISASGVIAASCAPHTTAPLLALSAYQSMVTSTLPEV